MTVKSRGGRAAELGNAQATLSTDMVARRALPRSH